MGSISRREAAARIERDDGDPTDEVLLSHSKARRGCYHDDEGCSGIKGATTQAVPRADAKRWERPPCIRCVLDELEVSGEKRRPWRDRLREARQ